MDQIEEKVMLEESEKISLDTKIEDLDLSVRIKRRFQWNGINTLQDLLNTDYQKIKSFAYLGDKYLKKLKDYIHSLGYQLLNEEPLASEKREELKNKEFILLEDFGFSSQIYLTLYRNDIFTLEDLVEYGIKVYDLKGFGPNRRKELREKLQELNIQLENKEKQKVESLLEYVKNNPDLTRENLPEEFASIKIQDLDLSNRIKKCFKYKEIYTLGQLLNTDYETITRINNLGVASLKELKNYIHSIGFTLLNEEQDIYEVIQELREKGINFLENYGLSAKVCLPLYRQGIYTMEEVLAKNEEAFYVKWLTQTGRKELLEKLLQLGLKSDLKEKSVIEETHSLGVDSDKKEMKFFVRTGLEMIPDLDIVELNFTVKVYNILIRNGIYTLEDLVNYGPAVYQLKGLSFDDAAIIKDILKKYDIEFLIEGEEDVPMNDSYVEVLQDMKNENEMIQIRCQRKEQLLKEYNDLMQERVSLLEKEAELDRRIEEQIFRMQEEMKGKSYVKGK